MAPIAQLNVRLSPQLRDEVVAAARRSGSSAQEWVARALEAALAGPAPTPADQLAASVRRELAQVVTSGDYQRWVDQLDDPDVA